MKVSRDITSTRRREQLSFAPCSVSTRAASAAMPLGFLIEGCVDGALLESIRGPLRTFPKRSQQRNPFLSNSHLTVLTTTDSYGFLFDQARVSCHYGASVGLKQADPVSLCSSPSFHYCTFLLSRPEASRPLNECEKERCSKCLSFLIRQVINIDAAMSEPNLSHC